MSKCDTRHMTQYLWAETAVPVLVAATTHAPGRRFRHTGIVGTIVVTGGDGEALLNKCIEGSGEQQKSSRLHRVDHARLFSREVSNIVFHERIYHRLKTPSSCCEPTYIVVVVAVHTKLTTLPGDGVRQECVRTPVSRSAGRRGEGTARVRIRGGEKMDRYIRRYVQIQGRTSQSQPRRSWRTGTECETETLTVL